MNFSIAIDGPAGSGKSTVAKIIAKKLSFIYVDTGAMYRTIALYFLQNNIDLNNELLVNDNLYKIDIKIIYNNDKQQLILNNQNVTDLIRTNEVSQGASIVSTYLKVRERLVDLQQNIAKNNNVVMDGRDIGSVVLPNAFLKIFLTASVSCRTKRRYLELKEKSEDVSIEIIEKEIKERDYRDTHRKNSPLIQVEDAILIDSTNMTINEVCDAIIELYQKRNEIL